METVENQSTHLESLSCFHRCTERLRAEWPDFLRKREQRLQPHPLFAEKPAEKVAEEILADLFTGVLDWPLSSFTPQVGRADLVVSDRGIKRLIIEAKRPGALAWNRRAVRAALEQAGRYAAEQKVTCIAVSDGEMLYAADLENGGVRDRAFVNLSAFEAPLDLWWLSVQGIWRRRDLVDGSELRLLPEAPLDPGVARATGEIAAALLHPKYKLPAQCFAYAGDLSKPSSWKLPFRLADGTVDAKRLPKAIQCVLSNYRGAKVGGIPEQAIPAVLRRLAAAAIQTGHMPPQALNPAPIYKQLGEALKQFGPQGETR